MISGTAMSYAKNIQNFLFQVVKSHFYNFHVFQFSTERLLFPEQHRYQVPCHS